MLLLLFVAIPCMAQEDMARGVSLRANLFRWATLTPDIGFDTTGIKERLQLVRHNAGHGTGEAEMQEP